MIREVIYADRDNAIDLQLSSDSGVADFTGVTKVELVDSLGGLGTINSETNSSFFNMTTGNGILKLSLGLVAGLVVGKNHRFSIILYDPDNENGVNWGQFAAVVH